MAGKRGRNEVFYGDSGTLPATGRKANYWGDDSTPMPHYGQDSGQALSEQAKSEADEYTDQAERMTRDMERRNLPIGTDREQFVTKLADLLRGKPARPVQPQEEEDQAAGVGKLRLYDKKGHDEFWNDPEELKRVGKLVRPKL